jgi:C1A family cysteine protease
MQRCDIILNESQQQTTMAAVVTAAIDLADVLAILSKVEQGIVTVEKFGPVVSELIQVITDIRKGEISSTELSHLVETCMSMLCSKAPPAAKKALDGLIGCLPQIVPVLQTLRNAKSPGKCEESLPTVPYEHKGATAESALGHKFCFKRGDGHKDTDKPLSKLLCKLNLEKAVLPSSVDLRQSGFMPPVMDQGNIGSCTAHGAALCLHYALNKEKVMPDFSPSRLYIYYTSRVGIEHEASTEDSGCQIRDVMLALKYYHCCDEKDMPYDTDKFSVAPNALAVANANLHKKLEYHYVEHTEQGIKQALAAGFPIVMGLQIFSSFESEEAIKTGVVPMPNPDKEALLGGHCLSLVKYDDATKMFTIRNSWGLVGNKGDFELPYEYLLSDLASDFWTIHLFE